MKFGVDTPWYDDPVERLAYNLYALNCEEVERIAREIAQNFHDDIEGIEIDDIRYSFNVSYSDAEAIYNRIQELVE